MNIKVYMMGGIIEKKNLIISKIYLIHFHNKYWVNKKLLTTLRTTKFYLIVSISLFYCLRNPNQKLSKEFKDFLYELKTFQRP